MGSRTGTRIVAVSALLGTIAALAAVVARAPTDRAEAGDTADATALAAPARAVRAQVGRLDPGASARDVQRAVRAAMDAVEALAPRIDASDERLTNALEREREYLDAMGSVLSNPRSPLAGELAERGERARAALAAAPGGATAAAATTGWDRVLAHAEARRGG